MMSSLEDDSINSFKWFLDNEIKEYSNKCHLITNKQSRMNLKMANINIGNSTYEKLLGVKVDNKLNFNGHDDEIIKKATGKVSALSRIFRFMNLTKRRLLMNSFFTSQFSYCPLIWMCHSKQATWKMYTDNL